MLSPSGELFENPFKLSAFVESVAVEGVPLGLELASPVPVPQCRRRHAENLCGFCHGDEVGFR